MTRPTLDPRREPARREPAPDQLATSTGGVGGSEDGPGILDTAASLADAIKYASVALVVLVVGVLVVIYIPRLAR